MRCFSGKFCNETLCSHYSLLSFSDGSLPPIRFYFFCPVLLFLSTSCINYRRILQASLARVFLSKIDDFYSRWQLIEWKIQEVILFYPIIHVLFDTGIFSIFSISVAAFSSPKNLVPLLPTQIPCFATYPKFPKPDGFLRPFLSIYSNFLFNLLLFIRCLPYFLPVLLKICGNIWNYDFRMTSMSYSNENIFILSLRLFLTVLILQIECFHRKILKEVLILFLRRKKRTSSKEWFHCWFL